jgi:type VI secretion system secreted protein Hcp
MAFDTFVYFPAKGAAGTDIKGETQDADMKGKNAFEIFSFSWGASNPVTIGSGTGGAGAGKASLSSFNVMKKTDLASPSLFKACCVGDHFPDMVVVLRKAGGASAADNVFITYSFKEVYVESVQWSGSTGGDDTPTESVSIAYGACKIEYKKQDATGKLSAGGEQAWSVVTNKAEFAV